ncbi:PPC domain-containing protein, partial [Singulisphaera rosea]
MMRKADRIALVIVLALGTNSALAQLPKPRLTSLSRLGVAVGESVDVTLRGTDLEGVSHLWFDHPGLRAFHLKDATFRVVCATGTTIGQHDLRAVGPFGVSNPRTFVVGDRPESGETEPNNAPEQANAITVNSVVNGEITATDIDSFAFEGKKGQRLFFDLASERVESRLDATLRIFGPDGREIAESRDAQGTDPFL